jgi:hypothetical protein
MRLAYQISVRTRIKNKFCKKNEKAWKKMVEKCSTSPSRHFSLKPRCSFIPKCGRLHSWICRQNFSKSMNALWTPFNLILRRDWHRYCTAQTHENFRIEKQTSDIVLQSADRGSLVEVVTWMSPAGHFVSPFIVFRRKNMKQQLMNGTPPGPIHAYHPSGWIPGLWSRSRSRKEF